MQRCASNFILEASLIPKVLFAVRQMKSKNAFENTVYEEA